METRSVLITGGASGLGRAIAERFGSLGDRVVIFDRDEASARAVASSIGGTWVTGDVTDPASCDAAVEQTVLRNGRIDVLVHCAGVALLRAVVDTDDASWHRMVSVLLDGTFYIDRAAARVMSDNGRIVNISSAAGVRALNHRGAYGAAKAGVIQLTRVLALELGARSITVNAVAPGPIQTPMAAAAHTEETHASWIDLLAIKRLGSPQEVAAAVCFLASEEAGFITGQVLAIDGGFVAGSHIATA